MDLSDIMMIPVYIFVAVILWRVLRLDAWLKPLIDEYRSPNALEEKVRDIEARLAKLEGKM